MKLFARTRMSLLKTLARGVVSEQSVRKTRMLVALGHDPAKHRIEGRTGKHPGLQVVTAAGTPVAFYTRKALRRKQADQKFMAAWKEAGA